MYLVKFYLDQAWFHINKLYPLSYNFICQTLNLFISDSFHLNNFGIIKHHLCNHLPSTTMETYFIWCIFVMTIYLAQATPHLAMSILVLPLWGWKLHLLQRFNFPKLLATILYSFSKSWLFMPYSSCLITVCNFRNYLDF